MPASVPAEVDERFISYFRAGMTVDQIAEAEQMSAHTVKSRVVRLYRKYNAHSRGELISLYMDAQRANAVRSDLLNQRISQLFNAWLGTTGLDDMDTISVALQLAFDIRVAPPSQLDAKLRRLMQDQPSKMLKLILALAALVPLDRSPDVTLRWLLERQNGSTVRTTGNGSTSR